MSYVKIDIHNRSIKKRLEGLQRWNISPIERKALLRFLDELELGKVNKGVKISEARRAKYLDMLKPSLESFSKISSKLAIKDIEKFEKKLSSDKFISRKGKPYSHATKADIRRALKIYLRWRLGTEKGNRLTDWLDTRDIIKIPDFLKESEIEKLYKACETARQRFLVAVLFDSGSRAGEFHNIRDEDIQLPENNQNYPKVTLKEEYSKTSGRTISLYWKFSLEAVSDFVKERRMKGIKPDEPIYDGSYDSARFFLMRLGKKVLGRPIHFHLFRHSSATYYASKLNRQQLCYRYGWKFSSNMPDIYISRSGMANKELDEKFTNTELSVLKEQLIRKEQNDKIKDERIQQLERKVDEQLDTVTELIANTLTKRLKKDEIKAALQKQSVRAG